MSEDAITPTPEQIAAYKKCRKWARAREPKDTPIASYVRHALVARWMEEYGVPTWENARGFLEIRADWDEAFQRYETDEVEKEEDIPDD